MAASRLLGSSDWFESGYTPLFMAEMYLSGFFVRCTDCHKSFISIFLIVSLLLSAVHLTNHLSESMSGYHDSR